MEDTLSGLGIVLIDIKRNELKIKIRVCCVLFIILLRIILSSNQDTLEEGKRDT